MGSTAEGVLMAEEPAGMANLHVHKRDRVVVPEGKAPGGGVKLHGIINTNEPRLSQVLSNR